jgi:Spy/CpxP family protein refolding chaperone
MRRLATALAALAFAASLSTGAIAKPHDNMMMGPGMGHRCPHGQRWVKPYQKRNGKWVKGYCR